jgi:hypothetical protein
MKGISSLDVVDRTTGEDPEPSGDLAPATAGRTDAEETGAEADDRSRLKRVEREKLALEATTCRLERRLQRAETIIAFQKKVAELLGISLRPLEHDEID